MKEITAFLLLYWWAPAGVIWMLVILFGLGLGANARRGDQLRGFGD